MSGLEEALRTSTSSGIDTQGAANLSVQKRQKHFGANKFKDVAQKAFFTLFWENLKDPTLVLLMAAALVRHMHVTCMHATSAWIPPCLLHMQHNSPDDILVLCFPPCSTTLHPDRCPLSESAWALAVKMHMLPMSCMHMCNSAHACSMGCNN